MSKLPCTGWYELLSNAVTGVTRGLRSIWTLSGLLSAEVKGDTVVFTLGYSHPIEMPIPKGLAVRMDKQTHLVLSGADKHKVGQFAAEIRALRPPDPYKNKGVRYTGERLKKKVGKAAAASGAAKA